MKCNKYGNNSLLASVLIKKKLYSSEYPFIF